MEYFIIQIYEAISMWAVIIFLLTAGYLYYWYKNLKSRRTRPTRIARHRFRAIDYVKPSGYVHKPFNKMNLLRGFVEMKLVFRLGNGQFVVINSLETIDDMLFNDNVEGVFIQTRIRGQCDYKKLIEGAIWREQRSLLILQMRSFGFWQEGSALMTARAARRALNTAYPTFSISPDLTKFLNTHILNIISKVKSPIASRPSDPIEQVLQTFLYELFTTLEESGTATNNFPMVILVPPSISGYNKFINSNKQIWSYIRDEINKRKENFKPEKIDYYFMHAYIRMLKESGNIEAFAEAQMILQSSSLSLSFGMSYLVKEDLVHTNFEANRLPDYVNDLVHEMIDVSYRAANGSEATDYNIPQDTNVYTNFFVHDDVRPDSDEVDSTLPAGLQYELFEEHRYIWQVLAKYNVFVLTKPMLRRISYNRHAIGEDRPRTSGIVAPSPSPDLIFHDGLDSDYDSA